MSITYSSLLLFSLIAVVLADNDWSQPCHSGVCSYDIPATAGGPSGTLKIWGSPTSISDITPASGWEIIGCSPDALAQNIRLVCKSHDTTAAGCDHLFQGIGAEGKIVRLPESCGKNAFARVANAWVPADQSIPPSISARVARRDGQAPTVQALTIDTNFEGVDPSKTGTVTFAIQGATIPGAAGDIPAPVVGSQRRTRLAERGFGIGSILGGLSDLNSFDTSKSTALPALDVDKTFNLLNKTVSCPPITASLKIDVGAKAHALASIGIAASGTFIPPKISSFGIISSVTADLEGSIDLVADVSGTLDSGLITLFEVGIPGLDFPGILSIGPNFQINAEATAVLDLNVDLNVGVNFHISNAQMTFPPSSGQGSSGAFQLDDTPLKLSASPSVTATGSVEAHIIPTLNIGVSALGGSISANVFLDLDASAKMTLTLEAQAQAGVTIQRGIADSPDMNIAHAKRSVDMDDIIVLTPWTTLTIPMSPPTIAISSGALPTDLPQQGTDSYPGLTSATYPAETDVSAAYSSASWSNSHSTGVTPSAVSSTHIRYSAASSPTAVASTPILISPIKSVGPVRIPPSPLTSSTHGSSVVGYPIPSSPVHETTIRGASSTLSASVNGHSSAASSDHPTVSVATPIGGSYPASPSGTAPILSSSTVFIGSPSATLSAHPNTSFTGSPTGYSLPTPSGAALPSSSASEVPVKSVSSSQPNITASTATHIPSSSGWAGSSMAAPGSPSSIKGYPSAVPSVRTSAPAVGSAGGYYPAPSASAHSNSSATAPRSSVTSVYPSGIAPTQYPGASSPVSSASVPILIEPSPISNSSGASSLSSAGRSGSSVIPSSSTARPSSSVAPSSSTARPSSSVAPSSSTARPSSSVAPSSSTARPSSSVVPSSSTARPSSSVVPSSSASTPSSVTPSHTSSGISATPSASASFGGCFDISAALNVNAGATGSFLGLFDSNTKITLFSKNFDLFKKCFGTPPSKRSVPLDTIFPATRALGLTCPASSVGAPVSVVDEVAKSV